MVRGSSPRPPTKFNPINYSSMKIRAIVEVKVTPETDVRGYIIRSTIERRVLGVLLYRKVYHYPHEGWRGEYFRN